jgi:hypothetical protein
MFGHVYYHSLIRKYVAVFGTLFNDVYLNRYDTDSDMRTSIKVPITYGPREKVLARALADPDLNRMPSITLPRMTFEMTSLQYASNRKLNTIGKRVVKDTTDPNQLKYQYNPVPYDISFTLSVITKNADEGANIVEQILPFFTPEWTTSVELIPEMDYVADIPVVLDRVSCMDEYEGDFLNRRAIIWTLDFTMKVYILGPIRKQGIIKFANTNIYDYTSSPNTHLSSVDVRPGLLANGSPTTNSAATVSIDLIESDDNYGYIVTVTNPNE